MATQEAGGAADAAEDTRREIMEATFRALRTHGYADLRVRDIGEELGKSRTLIHYHFDGKHDLVASFLEYLVEQYEDAPEEAVTEPWAALDEQLDRCLFGPAVGEADHWERMAVYHELFSQAQHDEHHRELFDEHYAVIRRNVTRVVEAGVKQGTFAPVDAEAFAQLLTDVIHAARTRRISLGHEDAPEAARAAVDEYVLPALAPDGEAPPAFGADSEGEV